MRFFQSWTICAYPIQMSNGQSKSVQPHTVKKTLTMYQESTPSSTHLYCVLEWKKKINISTIQPPFSWVSAHMSLCLLEYACSVFAQNAVYTMCLHLPFMLESLWSIQMNSIVCFMLHRETKDIFLFLESNLDKIYLTFVV